jgi:hypothetical protein
LLNDAIKLIGAIVLVIFVIIATALGWLEWLDKYPTIKKIVEAKALRATLLIVAIVLLFGVFEDINTVREALYVPPVTPKTPPAPIIQNQEPLTTIVRNLVPKLDTKPPIQVNSAPNGIAIGCGTVSNPTVNNFGPKPLLLSSYQQDYLASALTGFSGQAVEIDVDSPTPDTDAFASALQSSLKKAGIVANRTNALFGGPCLKYPGVSFMAGVNRYAMVEAVWNSLLGAKVVEGQLKGCHREGEPDELHIFVRPPS